MTVNRFSLREAKSRGQTGERLCNHQKQDPRLRRWWGREDRL